MYDGLDRLKIAAGPASQSVSISFPDFKPVTNILQQVTTNFYTAAGEVQTNVNALGEKTIAFTDALGRATRTEIRSGAGALVRVSHTDYSSDHHGYTVTEGSGAEAISTTTWTDNNGQPVVTAQSPDGWLWEYTWRDYDRNGNATEQYRFSTDDGWWVYYWTYNLWNYDGLNRMISETSRSNELTVYNRDALGSVTNRVMPGGLQWNARFNNAGQTLQDWITATDGSSTTRSNNYTYCPAGNAWAGLLQTKTEPRGITGTCTYDDWLRLTNVYRPTGDMYVALSTTWMYDARGLVTNITERNPGVGTGTTPKVISRSFDAYGQMISETVAANGTVLSSAGLGWDVAGRRSLLSVGASDSSMSYGYAWRADGKLAGVSTPLGGAAFAYDSAGVLTNRSVGNRSLTVTSRDGMGRPLATATRVNGGTVLQEYLGYYDDGLLGSHILLRPDFTDWRSYSYAADSRRLTEERLNLGLGTSWTNTFEYDGGTTAGPGVLTKVGATPTSPQWSGGVSIMGRVNTETNATVLRPAKGRVNGQATVRAHLDGKPLPVALNRSDDPAWTNQWRAMMELTPGAHHLTASADHPSGFFTTNTSVWFTNNAAGENAQIWRDSAGNVTRKLWRNADGTTNRTQDLWWDSKERLYLVMETDADRNGYLWYAEYDGLDRRVRVQWHWTTNGVAYATPRGFVELRSLYDPQVEFLELGVSESTAYVYPGAGPGVTTWKLCGPDLNGAYGGMNGVGGFEAASTGGQQFQPVIADARGNVLGCVTNGVVSWTAARPTGYGAVPGYRPLPLGRGGNLVESSAWRGKWVDITGYIQIGVRPYGPEMGCWMSYDPVWNSRDPNWLTAFGGDPVNYFDPDGRCIEKVQNWWEDTKEDATDWTQKKLYDTVVGGLTERDFGNHLVTSTADKLISPAIGLSAGSDPLISMLWPGSQDFQPFRTLGFYDQGSPSDSVGELTSLFVPIPFGGEVGTLTRTERTFMNAAGRTERFLSEVEQAFIQAERRTARTVGGATPVPLYDVNTPWYQYLNPSYGASASVETAGRTISDIMATKAHEGQHIMDFLNHPQVTYLADTYRNSYFPGSGLARYWLEYRGYSAGGTLQNLWTPLQSFSTSQKWSLASDMAIFGGGTGTAAYLQYNTLPVGK